MPMRHAMRVRARVARLRRLPTWQAHRMADTIEGKLLTQMGWTR
jgi:hypothetical protein